LVIHLSVYIFNKHGLREHVPIISLAQPFPTIPLTEEKPFLLHLKLTNPIDQEVKVELATTNNPKSASEEGTEHVGNCEVVIIAPQVTIPAFSEVGDYEDPPARLALPVGVAHIIKNTVTITVEITPKRQDKNESNRVEVSMFIFH
jgi:hypothetical protein